MKSDPPIRGSAIEILASIQNDRLLIQDFRPLAESIEWELGQLYWEERGSRAFISDDVPFTINNDGNLSKNAAEVLFVNLLESERNGMLESQIRVLEIGIGTGLFARYFLDAFQALCHQYDKDYYQKLCYIAADQSESMLADAEKHGIFSNHPDRYQLKIINALDPALALDALDIAQQYPLRAVFLNYVLDTLPASVLQVNDNQIKQLCIRTRLARGVNLSEYTSLSFADIVRKAAATNQYDKRELVDLYSLFALDYAYREVDLHAIPYGDFVVSFARSHASRCILNNHGALRCIECLLKKLNDKGFILINDYGYRHKDDPAEVYLHQRFSGSTAIGLNFDFLRFYLEESKQVCWLEPTEDNTHIYTRLLIRRPMPQTTTRFDECFRKTTYDWIYQPAELARGYVNEGNYDAALGAYRQAIERQPRNPVLLEEISRCLTYDFRDYEAGLELARIGLDLNPISPGLWNIFGDNLYYLGRTEEAHDAFLRALELNPADVRSRYNLIYTYIHRKDYASALAMIKEGLFHDKTGEYRERFLEKQTEILARLRQLDQQRNHIFKNRFNQFNRVS